VSTFLLFSAAMIVAALVMLLLPLLRAEPAVAKGQPDAPRAVPVAVVVMLALPFGAAALYGNLSSFPWDNPGAATASAGAHAQDGGSMEEVIAQLEARLQASPGDTEGWRMLGRTLLVSGRASEAVAAYEKASSLTGGKDPNIELDLAEALVLTENADVVPRAKAIIDATLAADENSQKALWYSGLMALRAGDPETTKARWTKLLEGNPPEEIRQLVVAQLEAIGGSAPVQTAAAESPPGVGATSGSSMGGGMGSGAAAAASGRTIRVAVTVDPALTSKMKPGSTVFVSAREAGIPGPPLAAVRLNSDELPTTVVLSDANEMVEGRNLSSVDEVQVVARVAFGGTAVVASGDLIGEARHRKGAAPDLSVIIDKVSP
jgi:cytochrome c-type biogenesis protein CcmH